MNINYQQNRRNIMYTLIEQLVYKQDNYPDGSSITQYVGLSTKQRETETEVITETFDLEQGTYIEVNRSPKGA